jgi:hypothetical protein
MEVEATAQSCPFSRQFPKHDKQCHGMGRADICPAYGKANQQRQNLHQGTVSKVFAVYFMNIKNRTDEHRTKFMDLLKDAVLENGRRRPAIVEKVIRSVSVCYIFVFGSLRQKTYLCEQKLFLIMSWKEKAINCLKK